MKRLAFLLVFAMLGFASAVHADDARYQASNVIDVTGALPPYTGAAWLVRTKDTVRGRIMTKVSTSGDPYTLWIVVFNNPAECASTPCTEADLFTDKVYGRVFYGTGAISSDSALNMDFHVDTGRLPKDQFVLFPPEDAYYGIHRSNGFGAEIHLVVDKHPSIQPGSSWLNDLTTTNFPNMGPATNEVAAIFLACPRPRKMSCPAGVL